MASRNLKTDLIAFKKPRYKIDPDPKVHQSKGEQHPCLGQSKG